MNVKKSWHFFQDLRRCRKDPRKVQWQLEWRRTEFKKQLTTYILCSIFIVSQQKPPEMVLKEKNLNKLFLNCTVNIPTSGQNQNEWLSNVSLMPIDQVLLYHSWANIFIHFRTQNKKIFLKILLDLQKGPKKLQSFIVFS